MSDWQPIETMPEGVEVETKIDDENGVRNVTTLVRKTRPGAARPLYWIPDMTVYVYYTPTHWRPL